jgi:hypothetical protein
MDRICDGDADAEGALPLGGALTEEEVADLGLADFEQTGSHSMDEEEDADAAELSGEGEDLPLEEPGSRSARTGYGLRPSTALRRPNRLVFMVRHAMAMVNEVLKFLPGSIPMRSPTGG